MTDLELITQNRNRKRNRDRTTNTIVYAALGLIALIALYPFYWTLLTSLETTGGLAFEFPPPWFPKAPGARNYIDVFSLVPVAQQVLNSLIICSLGVGASVLLATLGAYPLAKMNFPGRDFIFYAILATLVLPNEAGLIVNHRQSRAFPQRYSAHGCATKRLVSIRHDHHACTLEHGWIVFDAPSVPFDSARTARGGTNGWRE
jgi:ABC-type glycerol-3-phosphate transport system permease component